MNNNFKDVCNYSSYLNNINTWNTFYPSVRAGSTGIGATWEAANKVDENNSRDSDLNGLELKAKRTGTNSRLTLFTMNPLCMGGPVVGKLVEEFGKPHRKRPDDLSFHKTVRFGYNTVTDSSGYKVELARDSTGLVLLAGPRLLAEWPFVSLGTGLRKIEALSLAYADVRKHGDCEVFRFHTVYHYCGLDLDGLLNSIEAGDIVIEFRASFNDGSLRDRGTAFRIAPKKLEKLYQQATRIIPQNNIALSPPAEL